MTNEQKQQEWAEWLSSDTPTIIAGPCSAETEEQVMTTARQLKEEGIRYFRSGIWKPRTRPGSFEGVGEKGLPWLQRVQKELGMRVAVEVAQSSHVKAALEHGIDIIWIGARTSANPFAMQEIADVLHRLNVDIPVLVKNPVNPDLALWLGAIERIERAGISRVGAIHRGFSFYGNTEFRNPPHWQIPIELKRLRPDLPIICDPSHICGNRKMLQSIAQTAMDLNFAGLIIESHHTPNDAWSDAEQQITPVVLKDLLNNLTFRKKVGDNEEMLGKLSEFRELIDVYDRQILSFLSDRQCVTKKIGRFKKENNLIVLQTARWTALLEQAKKLGEKQGLSPDFVEDIFKVIHLESIRLQDNIMKNKKEKK